jgi:hypothetical protein
MKTASSRVPWLGRREEQCLKERIDWLGNNKDRRLHSRQARKRKYRSKRQKQLHCGLGLCQYERKCTIGLGQGHCDPRRLVFEALPHNETLRHHVLTSRHTAGGWAQAIMVRGFGR